MTKDKQGPDAKVSNHYDGKQHHEGSLLTAIRAKEPGLVVQTCQEIVNGMVVVRSEGPFAFKDWLVVRIEELVEAGEKFFFFF